MPISKPLSADVLKELQNEIGVKHNVDIQQVGFAAHATLLIKGQNFTPALQELIPIVSDINSLNLPNDWINPATQRLKKVNFAAYDMQVGSQSFQNVEALLKQTLPNGKVKRIQILQNF